MSYKILKRVALWHKVRDKSSDIRKVSADVISYPYSIRKFMVGVSGHYFALTYEDIRGHRRRVKIHSTDPWGYDYFYDYFYVIIGSNDNEILLFWRNK